MNRSRCRDAEQALVHVSRAMCSHNTSSAMSSKRHACDTFMAEHEMQMLNSAGNTREAAISPAGTAVLLEAAAAFGSCRGVQDQGAVWGPGEVLQAWSL